MPALVRVLGASLTAVLMLAGVTTAAVTAFEPVPVAAASGASRPLDAQPVVVRQILMGDTIVVDVEPGSQVHEFGTITVRLIGIDAPNFGITYECYSQAAQARLAGLLPVGSVAWVSLDATAKDQGGRWYMYVWAADGRFVNYLLAVDGYVRADDSAADNTLYPVIKAAQSAASSRFGGLWGSCF